MHVRSFTLLDLFRYNSPCKLCTNKTNLSFVIENDCHKKLANYYFVTNDHINLSLKTSYFFSLNIIIFPSSNKFVINKNDSIKIYNFLNSNSVYIEIYCKNCESITRTSKLTLDFIKGTINPFFIKEEKLFFMAEDYNIKISSSLEHESSIVYRLPIYARMNSPIKEQFKLDCKFMPLSNFNSREDLHYKIKTFFLFI